jgi:hypothetical protein
MFSESLFFGVVLLVHILAAITGAGSVFVTDFLHLSGINNRKIEKKLLFVYPIISKLIFISIVAIVLSGIALLFFKPELLQSGIFRLKMVLFGIIIVNGYFLQKKVFPELENCILKETPTHQCESNVFVKSAFLGSISLVSWLSILILALTKSSGYSVMQFTIFYLILVILGFSTALYLEIRRKKRYLLFIKKKRK